MGEVFTESHASTLPEEKGESLMIIIIQVFFASTNIYVWRLQGMGAGFWVNKAQSWLLESSISSRGNKYLLK